MTSLKPLLRRLQPARHRPRLSIVIVFYDMPRQALNTLYTLSTAFQRDVRPEDYEVIAVENRSDANIDPQGLQRLPGDNIRYFLREETLPTPVHAVNFGAGQARGDNLCIMVDGARMVTPRLVHFMIRAQALYDPAVVTVPGYHLGDDLQQNAVLRGYDETEEQRLLESVDWRENGYRLFDIACLSGTSRGGFFQPVGESNSLGIPRRMFEQLGGFDPGFTETGGGQCNLDFYKRALDMPETWHVFLPGEGSFHQYHGGVTTGKEAGEDRDETMQRHFDQYRSLRGDYYSPPRKDAIHLGSFSPNVLRFVHHSAKRARAMDGQLDERYDEAAAQRVLFPKRRES